MDRKKQSITSVMGVSITRLSPYFFHRPFETCHKTPVFLYTCRVTDSWGVTTHKSGKSDSSHDSNQVVTPVTFSPTWLDSRLHAFDSISLYTSLGLTFFAATGPHLWNSLPVQLRNPDITYGLFRWQLKGHFLGNHGYGALWLLICSTLEKHLLTYLLTYLPSSNTFDISSINS